MMDIIEITGDNLSTEEVQEKKQKYLRNVESGRQYYTSLLKETESHQSAGNNTIHSTVNADQETEGNKATVSHSKTPLTQKPYSLAEEVSWENEITSDTEMELCSSQSGALDFIKRNFSNLVGQKHR